MRTRSFPASLLVALALATGASAQVTLRVSVDSAGNPGDSWSGGFVQGRSLSISPDGRFVAFESLCTNLAPGDTNPWRDVFVHDRWSGGDRTSERRDRRRGRERPEPAPGDLG
jgi:hypothetical protein